MFYCNSILQCRLLCDNAVISMIYFQCTSKQLTYIKKKLLITYVIDLNPYTNSSNHDLAKLRLSTTARSFASSTWWSFHGLKRQDKDE